MAALTGVLIFLVLYLFWRINQYENYAMKVDKRMRYIRDKLIQGKTTEEMLEIKQDSDYKAVWDD